MGLAQFLIHLAGCGMYNDYSCNLISMGNEPRLSVFSFMELWIGR